MKTQSKTIQEIVLTEKEREALRVVSDMLTLMSTYPKDVLLDCIKDIIIYGYGSATLINDIVQEKDMDFEDALYQIGHLLDIFVNIFKKDTTDSESD